MSILLSGDNDVMHYAVGNERGKFLLAAFSTINEAVRGRDALAKQGHEDLVLHNLTHAKCPGWIMDIVRADPDYCERRAAEFQRRADGVRRQAETLLEEAARLEGNAQAWRGRQEEALAAAAREMTPASPR
jgi:hypothetical protein